MAQQPVELILLKQVAGYLSTAMFLVDPDGNLLFYNEPAEEILGHRYEETGPMPITEWGTLFSPTDSLDRPIPPEALPVARTLAGRTPSQGNLFIRGLDGVTRHVSVTALPLEGPCGTNLGALAVFWALPRR